MKKLSVFNKLVFLLNLIFAAALLISFLAPHVSVEKLPFLSILALGVPFLFIANISFVLYWLFFKKRLAFLSLFILVLGYFVMQVFYKIYSSEEVDDDYELKIMGYNVQEFNYSHEKSALIMDFILAENPDIVGVQEFSMEGREDFNTAYPHSFSTKGGTARSVQAIFSKYPIIYKEHIQFPNSANSSLVADILFKNDTIRVYVSHLQSLRIRPGMLKNEKSDHLYARLTKSFIQQESQVNILKKHISKSPYKTIICADMNNNQYSHVYGNLKGEYQDSFLEKGDGFGRTINFWRFPLRIDFILSDESFKVKSHQNFDVELSDHYPIMATFDLID